MEYFLGVVPCHVDLETQGSVERGNFLCNDILDYVGDRVFCGLYAYDRRESFFLREHYNITVHAAFCRNLHVLHDVSRLAACARSLRGVL